LKAIYRFAVLLTLLAAAAACPAQMPDFYKSANRVVWLVQEIDRVRPAWEALGLTDIHEYPNVSMSGNYHGTANNIIAWEITGHLGNLSVEMVQPAEGQLNAFNDFLGHHGDGIFSIVHEVHSRAQMDTEIRRMQSLGVNVLQQFTVTRDGVPVTYTFFDTEPQGKFVLGLVYAPGGMPAPLPGKMVTHLAPVVNDAASVSAFWSKLGFPAFSMEHATPRPDSRYRGQPLSLSFEVGYQHYDQFSYEWIVPPTTPPNIYADFLRNHHEGIQHIGIPVDDLQKSAAAYEKLGYHIHQSGAWGNVGQKNSGQYDYMDTDTHGGVAVELLHAY